MDRQQEGGLRGTPPCQHLDLRLPASSTDTDQPPQPSCCVGLAAMFPGGALLAGSSQHAHLLGDASLAFSHPSEPTRSIRTVLSVLSHTEATSHVRPTRT